MNWLGTVTIAILWPPFSLISDRKCPSDIDRVQAHYQYGGVYQLRVGDHPKFVHHQVLPFHGVSVSLSLYFIPFSLLKSWTTPRTTHLVETFHLCDK